MAILVSHQKSLCDSWTWNLPTNTENPLLLAQKGSPDGHLGFCEQGKLAKKLFGKTLQNSSSGQKKKMFYWNYFAVAWVTGRKQKYFDLPSVNEVCVTGVGAKKKKKTVIKLKNTFTWGRYIYSWKMWRTVIILIWTIGSQRVIFHPDAEYVERVKLKLIIKI